MIETYYKVPAKKLQEISDYIKEETGEVPDFIYWKLIEPDNLALDAKCIKIMTWHPRKCQWCGGDRHIDNKMLVDFKYRMREWDGSELSDCDAFLEFL